MERLRLGIMVLVAVLVVTHDVAAQRDSGDSFPSRAAIIGRVIDAQSAEPLPNAVVVIEPSPTGIFPAGGGSTVFPQTGRSAVTDRDGGYRFGNLPTGRYRLYVRRVGYRPASVEIDLRRSTPLRVSVGLVVAPIRLEPLETRSPIEPFGRMVTVVDEIEWGRIAVEQDRQERFLTSDVRSITNTDVIEAVTLGEPDLFRALQRLPGVSMPNALNAVIWSRGAPWDQTRVYFDGLPLFSPLHGLGMLSGLNADAVGAVFFHPGVRPASVGEGAAAVVDVMSRSAGGTGDVRGASELSLASVRLTMDRRTQDGRGGWMMAGRRSYIDGVASALGERFPYAFADLTGRWDLTLPGGRAVEVSGVWEEDRVRGDVEDELHGNRAHWGNAAGRVTLISPFKGLEARHTIGISRYDATFSVQEIDPTIRVSAPTHPPMDNTITYATLGSEVGSTHGAEQRWSAGLQLAAQRQRYRGPLPAVHGLVQTGTLTTREDLIQLAAWGERRWSPTRHVTVETGMRLELGAPVENGGAVRLAPRLAASYRPVHAPFAVSVGYGRSYQYTQSLGPSRELILNSLQPSEVWIAASDSTPALKSDVVTAGGEYWLGSGWLGAVNLYLRRTSGMAMPDPAPGIWQDRPLFVRGTNIARGVEFSLRRLIGRWTTSVGYSYGISKMKTTGFTFPLPSERKHILGATAMMRVGSALRIGTAFAAASGSPYTRVFSVTYPCGDAWWCSPEGPPRIEEPGAHRSSPFSSLDLLLDWTRTYRAWTLGVYVQVRNVLNRRNEVTYAGSGWGYEAQCRPSCPVTGYDFFGESLPLFPLIGFRVSF